MNLDFTEVKTGLISYSPKIAISSIILFVFYVIAKYVKNIVLKQNNQKDDNKKILHSLISSILYYFTILIGLLVALTVGGFSIESLLFLAGGIVFGLALACKDTISQVISGIVILFFNYFEIGDFVEIKEKKSYVDSFNLFNTTLIDDNFVKTVIPNNIIVSEHFNNFCSKKEMKIEFVVAISNNQKVDYNKLIKNIERLLIKKSKFIVPKKDDDKSIRVEVAIQDTSGSSTNLKINVLINNKDYEDALDDSQLIVRTYLNDENIKLKYKD